MVDRSTTMHVSKNIHNDTFVLYAAHRCVISINPVLSSWNDFISRITPIMVHMNSEAEFHPLLAITQIHRCVISMNSVLSSWNDLSPITPSMVHMNSETEFHPLFDKRLCKYHCFYHSMHGPTHHEFSKLAQLGSEYLLLSRTGHTGTND